MKKLTLILTLVTALFAFSCEERLENSGINQEELLTSGKWNILFFFDEQGDRSGKFYNTSFSFMHGGVLTATKSSVNTEGKWHIGEESQDSKRMNINFSDANYESLNREWIISEITVNKVELMRFGPNGTENLVFSK